MALTEFSPSRLRWSNRYLGLGSPFALPQRAQGLHSAHWVATSADCASWLGWPAQWWHHPDALPMVAGLDTWPGMQPHATVYSGHQFGHWAGQLGDGRALMLGELETPHGPQELQLKGSGRTPYSRMGDGRAVLRSSIREFLCSEAMHHLGVPTTRALALVAAPVPVQRERVEAAACVLRVAPSFLRFGHFEHFCHHGHHEALAQLLAVCVDWYFPALRQEPQPALALLQTATERTAELMAHWQALGFCHGVMNTDNMSILGLTLDYGPFGFLDGFDPHHICNHSDHHGRYAFARQPQIAWWNLHALAQALLPLIASELAPNASSAQTEAAQEAASTVLDNFGLFFQRQFSGLMRKRLGLQTEQVEDGALIDDWLKLLAQDRTDYPIASRLLCDFNSQHLHANSALRDHFVDRAAFDRWAERYAQRLHREGSDDAARHVAMKAVVPALILRQHLAQQAIERAEAGDYSEVQRLHEALSRPYDDRPPQDPDVAPPPDWARQLAVSCSS